jgi:oligopeptide/dipeptide ABC transporter ATP-binding protein
MSKELEVRNLQISFRTNNGLVRAVRDISFDIEKGETLCIVGESGSGKSVTAKAVMGILAGNSIVEGGEIIYHGSDLLKYSEKDFDQIRGNKITMIFQDPLSSLDPIVKIGKQMTEATLLNGKTNRKNAKKSLNHLKKLLERYMNAAGCDGQAKERLKELFQAAEISGVTEHSYRTAREYTESAKLTIDQFLVDLYENDPNRIREQIKDLDGKLSKIYGEQWISKDDVKWQEAIEKVKTAEQAYDGSAPDKLRPVLEELRGLMVKTLEQEIPDFTKNLFIPELLEDLAKTLKYAAEEVRPKKEEVVQALRDALPFYEKEEPDHGAWAKKAKALSELVASSMNPLVIRSNSYATTFATTMDKSIKRYFKGVKENPKELDRVERDTKKREQVIAKKGDAPNVVPPILVDLELTRKSIITALVRLSDSYELELLNEKHTDYHQLAKALVEEIQELSYAKANKITKEMAYDKAIRIMEDVGIKDPKKRFNQYPFEFSGGMRQRIVIAIAIAANPDILICDEPTTALDVTIQAQIMELINDVKKKRQLTVIFITHDLGVVANMADKVAVMYAGKIVEYGTADDVFYQPAHPYTWALLASMPDLDTKEKLEAIPGTPPNMIYPPVGDAFAERNQYAMEIDYEKQPPLFQISETHFAATWLLHPNAPKVDPPKSVTDRIRRMKELEAASNE